MRYQVCAVAEGRPLGKLDVDVDVGLGHRGEESTAYTSGGKQGNRAEKAHDEEQDGAYRALQHAAEQGLVTLRGEILHALGEAQAETGESATQ